MSQELNRQDIRVLLDCLVYKEKGTRDRPYMSEDAEAHRQDYRLEQARLQELDTLKDKLRRIRESLG